MILSSWLTTVSNRIRNASARRRFSRKWKGNRFTQQANPNVRRSPAAFSQLSSHIRKAVWQTFDASPRWTSDSRRFQRQVWNTSDVATVTEKLEDRTLLAVAVTNTAQNVARSGNPLTFSDFSVPAGNDLAIVAQLSIGSGGAALSDFNGVTFTEIVDAGFLESSLWIATLGDSGAAITDDIVLNGGGNLANHAISILALSGVDQTTPFEGAMTNNTPGTSSSLDITSESGDLVVDVIVAGFVSNSPMVGSGQTVRATGVHTGIQYASSSEPGASTTQMSWSGLGTSQLAHAAVNINQAAPQPAVNLSVSANAGTEAGTTAITVTATASAAVSGAQTVDVAVTDSTTGDLTTGGIRSTDFALSGGTITIPDTMTTGTVTFTVQNDDLVEALTETARLTISNPSAGITLGTTTTQDIAITDNDTATISISSPSVAEGGNLTFSVTTDKAVDVPVTANRATADGTAKTGDSDYTALSSSNVQLFAAGSTTASTINVTTKSS